jgi:type I restriction enzyme, S subunit
MNAGQNHGFNGLQDDTDYQQASVLSVKSANPRQSPGQNHGLDGLSDDTDSPQASVLSVKSSNPCQSPGQNHGFEGLPDDTDSPQASVLSVKSSNPCQSVIQTPPGYKQTEVGVIPEDWDLVTLSVITSEIGDGIHATPIYSTSGDYFFINGNNIRDGRIVITEDTMTVDYPEFKKYKKNLGDRTILLSINGTIGNLGLFAGEAIVLGKSAAYLNVKDDVEKKYLYFYLQTEPVRRQFNDGLTGTTIRNLGLATIRNTQIALPPTLAEQRAIAEAVSDADALIESLEQLIAKKRLIKQGAMQELLTGKRRLPGFSGEWEMKRFGELGSTFGGLTGKTKSDFGEGTARYITFMNILTNVVIDCGTFEHVKVSPTESQNRVMKGDLFFNGSSETPEEVGMCAVLAEDVYDVFLNSFCFGFRFRNGAEADGIYLAYFFRGREGRELLKSLAQGATRYNLSKTALLKVTFPFPRLPEQTAIAAILSDMDAEIAALEAKLVKARRVKQGMMQELLTGRIRLV